MKNSRPPQKSGRGPARPAAGRGSAPSSTSRAGGKPDVADRAADRPARGAKPAAGRTNARTGAPRPEAARESAPPAAPALQAQTGKHNLLYGLHAVAAAWTNPERKARTLFATEGAIAALAPTFARAEELGLERPQPTRAEKDQIDKLLPAGSVHQGVALDVAPLPEVQVEDICIAAENDDQALVVVLDQVTDPHNVGAILRSAAAFGAKAVIVQDRHAPPVTGVLAKTASGAVDAVPLVRVTNLARAIGQLQQAAFWCVGLDESGGKTLPEVDVTGRTAIVLGSEGEGLRRLTAERCDEIARLPTRPPIGSLNVSNAAAVALYEVARRR